MKSAQEKLADFKEETKRHTFEALTAEMCKLATSAQPGTEQFWKHQFEGFSQLFARFLTASPMIDWKKIQPLPDKSVRIYSELAQADPAKIKEQLSKLVVVKLNGGLGTSMGCKGPKSIIAHLNRTYDVNVPLVLMNSFNTHEDIRKLLPKYSKIQVHVETFNQSQYPRVDKETLMPIAANLTNTNLEDWYPPGHGDFYQAFANSPLLDKFLAEGKEYVFISNIDNMGATVDLSILNFLMTDEGKGAAQPEFVMEVTDKTRADVKGGTLIHYEDSIRLLEIAQVPKDHVDEFKSVSKFSIFNTNNLWAKLQPIKQLVDEKKMVMEIIVNPKHLDSGANVIQLETAAGAAIKNFNNACAINVPRDRFLPVKKTSDLLLLMSNLYDMKSGSLTLSANRQFRTTPIVKLGTSFDKVREYMSRFPGVPDLLELDHLTVSGDVTFGKNVTLKGTVIIIANHGERIDIPMGAFLENKIVSGNLRILDH